MGDKKLGEMTHKDMIGELEKECDYIQVEIKHDFFMIARRQQWLRSAKNAIEYHKRQSALDNLIYFCNNGVFPDE